MILESPGKIPELFLCICVKFGNINMWECCLCIKHKK